MAMAMAMVSDGQLDNQRTFTFLCVNFLFVFSFAKNKRVFLGQFSFFAFFCKEQKCVIAAGQDEGPGVDHILKCTFASFALLNNHQNQHNHHHHHHHRQHHHH